MQTFDNNQLAQFADYINGSSSHPPHDLGRLAEDDEFAMSVSDIAEISSLAQKQLNKSRTAKIISILAIAAAAAIAAFVFIPTDMIKDAAPTLQASMTTAAKTQSADNITAENGVATVTWSFEATDTDTLVIYDENSQPIIKKAIKGSSATVALPASATKFTYRIERNSTDVLKKGTISIKK